jgi:hypothetical protein
VADKRFTLQDFKNWLSHQDMSNFFNLNMESQTKEDEYVGRHAKARVCESKLLEKIKCDDEDPQSLVQDFVKNGGEITSIEGKMLYIETNTGSFSLPRFCVKVKKPE